MAPQGTQQRRKAAVDGTLVGMGIPAVKGQRAQPRTAGPP